MPPAILEGVRVVELTEALAGPYCAMLMGDLGADVVKVERPGIGDQSRTWGPPFVGTESAYFLAANRNKRSMTLDYDNPEDLDVLHRLIASADVLLCNRPSQNSLARRGLDPASLRAKFTRLIYCSITGYGFTGPNSGKPGYDILAQAESGVMSFTGEPDGVPMRFPIAIADMTTGIYAFAGILGALYARERNGGIGDFLDMSLFDSQLTWLANIGSNYLNAGVQPERWGNAHPSIVPYQPFRGSDGRLFVVGVGTQVVWLRLLRLLNLDATLGVDARFKDNAARVRNREDLIPVLQTQFDNLSAATWLAKLSAADIPAAAIQTVAEALSDPQSIARNLIVEIEHPMLRTARSIANPIRYQRQIIQYRLPPPALGEHNSLILNELGYSALKVPLDGAELPGSRSKSSM
jgi:crotonobetainyl-CoA:carnitine CoA-transferase CaiB-like acyl-CoA transferase